MKVYPPQVDGKLGFDAVRARLARTVRTEAAAERARALSPLPDAGSVRTELGRVEALQGILAMGDPAPDIHFEPTGEALARAAPAGAWLEPEELSAIRSLLACVRRVRAWLARTGSESERVAALAALLEPLPALEREIDGVIDAEGRVRDDASDTLVKLRRDEARTRDRLRGALQDALRRANSEGWAVEEQPTIRGGRMVIPLRAEARRKLEGIVHDVSATGQTVFVEPAACVELNNDLRTLEAEVRREIVRLLTRLTNAVRAERARIGANEEAAVYLDLVISKARLANDLDARVPEDLGGGTIVLRAARNPELLLRIAATDVVPLDLELGGDCRLLVISGPNAGGKSVALKTIGLFAVMLASGLPVPCAEGSRFDRFERLFVQMGDDQSVEDDLSTFSSQLRHVRAMLEGADGGALVLLDEAGSGTDPEEGSALAQAALERLLDAGALIVATTHHANLKRFAHEREQACNGMMAFDRERLTPTFRFEAGIPGASYAFEIADRIGFDRAVTDRARELLGADRASLEQLLTDLQARNEALEERINEASAVAAMAEERRHALDERLARLKEATSDIRERALEEAEAVIRDANAEVERAVREIREAEADRTVTRAARERLEGLRSELGESRRRAARKKPRLAAPPSQEPAEEARPIGVGDQVVIDNQGPAGDVLEVRESEAVVAVGSARMRVKLDRLARVGGARAQQVTIRRASAGSGAWTPTEARTRIDLRGRRVDEALAEVVRLIDEAVAAGLPSVEILHGKGTGALRSAIHEYLAGRDDVSGFEEAPVEQGGAGVTVVRI
jgi:DNA mismatch repair protein MutS2